MSGGDARRAERRRSRSAVYRRRRAAVVGGGLLAAAAAALLVAGGDSGDDDPQGKSGSGGSDGGSESQAPTREEPARLSASFSGDLLIHSPVFFAARANAGGAGYDFVPMLRPIRPWVNGTDLAVCHVETPIGVGEPIGEPLFDAPAELSDAIAETGWEACTTASNHTLDYKQEGVDRTLELLDRGGVEHAGSYSSAKASRKPLIIEKKGVRVAILTYTTDTNGLPLPSEWTVNIFDPERVRNDAAAAREAGAEVVVVSVHWASELVPEYVSQPGPGQKDAARDLARNPDITAVVGQGPHQVQPIEWVDGTPIVYSAGNLLSNQSAACCSAASQDGLIALIDFKVDEEGDRATRVRYVPVWVRRPDYAVLPVGQALADGSADPAALNASWERTVGVVGKGNRVEPIPRRLKG